MSKGRRPTYRLLAAAVTLAPVERSIRWRLSSPDVDGTVHTLRRRLGAASLPAHAMVDRWRSRCRPDVRDDPGMWPTSCHLQRGIDPRGSSTSCVTPPTHRRDLHPGTCSNSRGQPIAAGYCSGGADDVSLRCRSGRCRPASATVADGGAPGPAGWLPVGWLTRAGRRQRQTAGTPDLACLSAAGNL